MSAAGDGIDRRICPEAFQGRFSRGIKGGVPPLKENSTSPSRTRSDPSLAWLSLREGAGGGQRGKTRARAAKRPPDTPQPPS